MFQIQEFEFHFALNWTLWWNYIQIFMDVDDYTSEIL